MDYRLLGPLEVLDDDSRQLSIGAGRQRALLILLLLRANEPVTRDRLVEELWGESPPATAHKMLHNQVSALRRELGGNGRLETQGSAYRLDVHPGELDIAVFEELVARGRAQIDEDPVAAADTLRQALELWRGPPLSDVTYERFAQAEINRLEEERWAAFEARMDAELAVGRHAELVAELEAAVAEQPLRERLRGQLMLALYRSGRQAEALEAYRRARSTLVAEVGIEPGAELRRLQEAILAQDPSLDAPAQTLPAALQGGSPLLAGRDGELARLSRRLAEAREGRGGTPVLHGPPGIGKTRLAAEVARAALRESMVVQYVGAEASPDAVDRAAAGDRATLIVIDEPGPDLLDRVTALARDAHERRVLFLVLQTEGAGLPGDLVIELGPLGPEAVDEIARLYLPAGSRAAPPPALAAESGGVPATVHSLAATWARDQAAEALDASADRTAAERRDLRAAETDLAGDVLALQAADERGRRLGGETDGAPEPAVCPFLGLTPFDAAQAEYFFGRERLVAELVARLVGSPLLAVIGPSGSGKSSVVRAGLLPALADGGLPGSERWRQVLMRPGEHPLRELERTLPTDDGRLLLVVDQFEEVFTACRDPAERTAFLDALVGLAEDREQHAQVVIAMRADFYGRCAAHDGLARLIGANQVLVGPMRRDELRRAIEEPARRVGLRVEPALTDALISDVLDAPGGLPLLSAALLEQWREREGRTMRHATYERTGGVHGAVGRLAEHTYARLGEPERQAARRILMRLADAGEQESAFVRRRVPLDELDPGRDEPTAAALEALIDSRLVTADEDTLEVAHEALLSEWPRLRSWLEEDTEGRRLHQHLTHAALDWQAAGREPGELYRGARLASALDWSAGHEEDLNALERGFLDESRAAAEREAERQQRANRRLRTLLAGLAALLALAIVAGVVALNQRGEARDAAVTADAQRLGVEALGTERVDEAVRLTRAAVELDESPATRGTLLSALLRAPAAIGVVNHGWPMYGAALSPDGRLMATGSERGDVTVYDAATRRPLGPPYRIKGLGLIQNVRFSPDGGTLAASSMDPRDPNHNGIVDLIDPRTRERKLRVRLPRLTEPAGFVYVDVVFPPSGRDLIVRQVPGDTPDAPAPPVYRVDGKTGAVEDRLNVGQYPAEFYASETADRERFFLTSQRENLTWELDPEPLRVVRSWPAGDEAGAVSPDGAVFALGSDAGRVRLLDLDSGQIRPLRGRHEGAVNRMRFTPDGQTLVTSSATGELFAWDVERGRIAQRFAGHTGDIGGLDLTADGRTLITASDDTRAILWDLAGDRRLDRRFGVGRRFEVHDTPRGIAVSPDGGTLALTHSDGAVDLIDTRTLKRRASVRAIDGMALSVDFSPDGRLLAVTGERGRLTLWNARTLAPAGELRGMRGHSQALAFSPDGKLLAAAEGTDNGPRQPLRVWDVRRRTLTAFRGRTSADLIAFSPNGELVAAAANFRGADIRDARTGRLVKRFGDPSSERDFLRSVAFSPDGDLLFVGQFNGTGRLFSTETWKQVGRPFEAHTERITFPEFTPDGRTLVTAAADGTVALSDVKTQKPIGSPLELEPNTFASAALSPNGARLYAISTETEGISFNMSPEAWKRHACLVAGRELTPAEWAQALPGRPYQRVCTGD